MARAWFVLALLVVPMAPTVRAADADKAAEAATAFQSLYGADLDRLKASRDPKESVAFAARLLAAAKQAAGQPEFVAVLCEKAYALALAHPDGYATAVEAVQLEAAAVPEKVVACADRLVEVRQKQFDLAKGDARPSAGETLIDAVLAAADVKQKARPGGQPGAAADAMASYKRALIVARAVKSDRAAAMDANVKALEQAVRLAAEIESLKKLLALEPQNQAARQRLVRLHLVDLDDPAEAAKLLEGVEDASLLKYVPAAAKPLETVPEFACLELGEWYRSLADAAPPAAKPLMLARAKAYCERFLQLHTAEDLNRAKAALALQKIEEELRAAPPARTSPEKAAGWIDLLALVDPAKDAVKGNWERRGAGVASAGDLPSESRFTVPVAVHGSYELEVAFVRTSGNDTVGILAPIGATSALVAVSARNGTVSGISRINGKNSDENETTIRPGRLENGRSYTLAVKVAIESDNVSIGVQLDGRPYMSWKGPVAAIAASPLWRVPTAGAIGLGAANCKVEFSSARLRMLSGEAKPLRAAEKPAAVAGKTPPRTKQGPGGQPIDLLALVNPQRDAVLGDWSREADGLVMRGPGGSRLAIPCAVEGDYELKVEFARMKGDNEVAFILPVGSRCTSLLIGKEVGKRSGLFWAAQGETMVSPAPLANGEPHALEVTVKTSGGAADIDVRLDGKPYFHWQGANSSVSLWDAYKLPPGNRLGLGAWGGEIVFKSAHVRMLSGQAKVLTPAGAK